MQLPCVSQAPLLPGQPSPLSCHEVALPTAVAHGRSSLLTASSLHNPNPPASSSCAIGPAAGTHCCCILPGLLRPRARLAGHPPADTRAWPHCSSAVSCPALLCPALPTSDRLGRGQQVPSHEPGCMNRSCPWEPCAPSQARAPFSPHVASLHPSWLQHPHAPPPLHLTLGMAGRRGVCRPVLLRRAGSIDRPMPMRPLRRELAIRAVAGLTGARCSSSCTQHTSRLVCWCSSRAAGAFQNLFRVVSLPPRPAVPPCAMSTQQAAASESCSRSCQRSPGSAAPWRTCASRPAGQ